jgi:hypothetical protein
MRNTADVTGGKPIAVLLQSISGVTAINPLVAFYDIYGGKREVLFFYFVPDTTRDSRTPHERHFLLITKTNYNTSIPAKKKIRSLFSKFVRRGF